jgi:hypothetical protein
MTYPDAPISLVENLAARTVSTIGVQWQIGPNNNGATVTEYVVSMATGSGAYVVLYSGLSTFITSATATNLTFGTQYTFVIQSGNLFGLSEYSAPLTLICATVPAKPPTPITT